MLDFMVILKKKKLWDVYRFTFEEIIEVCNRALQWSYSLFGKVKINRQSSLDFLCVVCKQL